MKGTAFFAAVASLFLCGAASEVKAFTISADAIVTQSEGNNRPSPYSVGDKIQLYLDIPTYSFSTSPNGVNTVSFIPRDPFGYVATPFKDTTLIYGPSTFSLDYTVGVDGGVAGGDGSTTFGISAGGPTRKDAAGFLYFTSNVMGYASDSSYGPYFEDFYSSGSVQVEFNSFVFDPGDLPTVSVVPIPSSITLFALGIVVFGALGLARKSRVVN